MNTVTMKNVEFGAGVPKICVPICGKTKEDVLEQAKIILDTPADIIEWRMDWFEQVENTASVVEMAKELREVFKETPVLATFRSKKEGGELEVSTEYYVELNCAVAKSGYVDAVDVELYTGDKEVETIEEVVEELDILYMTRVQKERFFNEQDYIRLKDTYILDLKKLEKSKSDLIVMHPLPRVNEIAIEVDDDPRAKYFDQVQNGRFMRMALILKMLGLENEVER